MEHGSGPGGGQAGGSSSLQQDHHTTYTVTPGLADGQDLHPLLQFQFGALLPGLDRGYRDREGSHSQN